MGEPLTGLDRFLELGAKYCCHSYQFNANTKGFMFTKSRKQVFGYTFLTIYLLLDCIYLSFKVPSTVHATFRDCVVNYGHWITRSAASVLNILEFVDAKSWIRLINTFKKFDSTFQGKFWYTTSNMFNKYDNISQSINVNTVQISTKLKFTLQVC